MRVYERYDDVCIYIYTYAHIDANTVCWSQVVQSLITEINAKLTALTLDALTRNAMTGSDHFYFLRMLVTTSQKEEWVQLTENLNCAQGSGLLFTEL